MIASIIGFVSSHMVALCMLGVALLDFAIEMNPSLKSNGLVSLLLSLLKKGEGVETPPAGQ